MEYSEEFLKSLFSAFGGKVTIEEIKEMQPYVLESYVKSAIAAGHYVPLIDGKTRYDLSSDPIVYRNPDGETISITRKLYLTGEIPPVLESFQEDTHEMKFSEYLKRKICKYVVLEKFLNEPIYSINETATFNKHR